MNKTTTFIGTQWIVNADVLVGFDAARLYSRKITVLEDETIRSRMDELRYAFDITGYGEYTEHNDNHVSWTQHPTATQIHAWRQGEVWEHAPDAVLTRREQDLYWFMNRGEQLGQRIVEQSPVADSGEQMELPLQQPELDAFHHALSALLCTRYSNDEIDNVLDAFAIETALKRRAAEEGRLPLSGPSFDELPWNRTLEPVAKPGSRLAALLKQDVNG
jgi:hypothetical protein